MAKKKRRTTKRTTRRKTTRRRRKQPTLPTISLTLDQWLDIAGYVLLAASGLTALCFLSPNRGAIPGAWVSFLMRGFGWGAYPLPLIVGASAWIRPACISSCNTAGSPPAR